MEQPTGELQFDRAEPAEQVKAGLACAGCNEAIVTSYWQVNGVVACARCHDAVVRERKARRPGRFFLAGFYGTIAAALGAGLYYAVAAATGYEFGLIGIVVGLAVGMAVKKGAQGRGGWGYQGLAMALTYLAIVSTYVPLIVKAAQQKAAEKVEATATAVPAAPPDVATQPVSATAQDPAPARPAGAGSLLLGLALLAGLVIALPFLAGFENIMGIAIIAFSLYEAWKINRAPPFVVSGPYDARQRAAAGAEVG